MKVDKKVDITNLREKFIIEYSKKKGWNHKKLSPSQLIEIVNNRAYPMSR